MTTEVLIGLLIFLALCSAFLSSAETSTLGLNRFRLRHLSKQGRYGASRVASLLSRPDRLLDTLRAGNTLVTLLFASIATVLALRTWADTGTLIANLGGTLLLLMIAKTMARTFASLHPLWVIHAFSLPLVIVQKTLSPAVVPLSWISRGLLRIFGKDLARTRTDSLSNEELRSVVREAGQSLPLDRRNMLLGVLDLETITVDDVMVPRNEVLGIDLEDTLDNILEQLRQSTHTRLPLFRHDINHAEGVVHMRHIARLLSAGQLSKDDLLAASLEPYFVPEGTPLATQLLNFQQLKRRFGLVVDEYGEVLGAVTLEDILEEIVGEFHNRENQRDRDITVQADGTRIIEGAISIRDLNRALDWSLPCDGPKTLNGLITEALESIPDSAVCLPIGDYRLEILATEDNRVKRVRAWEASLNLAADNDTP